MAGKENLVVGSKVRAYVAGKKFRTSGEVLGGLSNCVRRCLDKAIDRAKANGRQTVKSQDL